MHASTVYGQVSEH